MSQMAAFFAGVECMKDGFAFDPRFRNKRMRFDRPQVVLFCNHLPRMDFMTWDRTTYGWLLFCVV
jgi:hypothetical protein